MENSTYDEMAGVQEEHWWFVGRRKILREIVNNLELPKEARILEIGSGTGANLKMLSEFGETVACEFHDASREKCAAAGWKTIKGLLPDGIPRPDNKYDLICLFDVLEHVEEDVRSVRNLKKLLNANGRVLIACPAYQWLYGEYDKCLQHFRRYNSKTLAGICIKEGYLVERVGYFNTLLFPLSLVSKAVEFTGINIRRNALSIPFFPINSLLGLLFSVESCFARKSLFPFGTTVVVQARIPTQA